jgi:hypothetical protein
MEYVREGINQTLQNQVILSRKWDHIDNMNPPHQKNWRKRNPAELNGRTNAKDCCSHYSYNKYFES